MSKLAQLIAAHCPQGVPFVPLSEIGEISTGNNKSRNLTGKYSLYGSTGVISQTNTYKYNFPTILIARVGANCGYVHLATGLYDVSDNTLILKIHNQKSFKYIFYQLISMNINQYAKGGGQPLITASLLKSIKIPLPPLAVQAEIVRILDKFSALSAELSAELSARVRQYHYYRNHLLSFDATVPLVPLGEVVNIRNGKDHKFMDEGQIPVYGSGGIMRYASEYIYEHESVLIPRKGSLRNIFYVDTPFWTVDTIFYTEISSNILAKYAYFFLASLNLEKLNKAGGVPSLTKSLLEKIKIPLPPLAVQAHIVALLDRFDSLTSSLTTGLPAEIEARQKQFIYYRNHLLSFKELTS